MDLLYKIKGTAKQAVNPGGQMGHRDKGHAHPMHTCGVRSGIHETTATRAAFVAARSGRGGCGHQTM